MEISRRKLLAGAASVAVFRTCGYASADTETQLFAAARQLAPGVFSTAIFDPSQGDVMEVSLPARGHDIAVRPRSLECVTFARRPERFAVAFSPEGNTKPKWFYTKENRHFFGHGIFSSDGRLLYSTENDYETGNGVIGIRDAGENYRQIGEFASYGIGPHDIALLDDGRTLVVANGGIKTHPETGHRPLNLAEMQPSLAYIDAVTGDLIEKHFLDASLNQLSIRHLAVAANGWVAFGCQHKGAKTDEPPLIGFHRRGELPKLVTAPESVHRSMRNYIGSVGADKSGTVIAASAPRGNLITYWDPVGQKFLGTTGLEDGCGVSETHAPRSFLFTSGQGYVCQSKLNSETNPELGDVSKARCHWDNHISLVQ